MEKIFSIRWTENALDSFEETSLKLIDKWGFKTAKELDNEVDKLVIRLESNSKLALLQKR
ncbi:MAG: hypothetical protein JKY53_02180 [Flavobacteriales bacterium]|nr:hypothetical protein [Flavobacteriales bacterium]